MKKGRGETFARHNGSLITGLTLAFHYGLILVIARAVTFKSTHYHSWPFLDNFPIKAIGLLIMLLPFFYYTQKRVEKIKMRHNNEYFSLTIANALKFILITLVPLLIIIKLSSK